MAEWKVQMTTICKRCGYSFSRHLNPPYQCPNGAGKFSLPAPRVLNAVGRGNKLLRKIKRGKNSALLLEDMRWSGGVKAEAGYRCMWPGCANRFEGMAAHHFFTRSIKATRHDPANGVCLCNGHHFNAHKDPHGFREIMIKLRGQEWFDRLNAKAKQRGPKLDGAGNDL